MSVLTIHQPQNCCTPENIKILQANGLLRARLYNLTGPGILQKIAWTQITRNIFGCEETYRQCLYKDENGLGYAVFIALTYGDAPESLVVDVDTINQNGCRLFFGASSDHRSVFFVIHPPDWFPFQKRFIEKIAEEVFSDNDSSSFHRITKASSGQTAFAASGALGTAVGSTISPGVGTAAGAIVGFALCHLTDASIGHYLRYL